MKKISDIPTGGIFYNDGSFVYFIEHLEVCSNRIGSVYALLYLKMTIEQANNFSSSNKDNMLKLARAKFFYRTQKETINIIGKTTKESFDARVYEYKMEILNKIQADEWRVLTFQNASNHGSGYEKKFKNGKEMRDFFNEIKANFGDVS